MKIKLKKLREDFKMPTYALAGDVGLDLFAYETVILKPGAHHRFWSGFALEFPNGFGAFVMDKSSISKAGLKTMGGVFDAGYRGEYNVHVVNLGSAPYTVEAGDKIAQLVILPVAQPELILTEELSESERGKGGFGSTGKK